MLQGLKCYKCALKLCCVPLVVLLLCEELGNIGLRFLSSEATVSIFSLIYFTDKSKIKN